VTGSDELVQVHLLQLPVPLAEKARQHFEELQREFALIAARPHAGRHEVPARLTQLVDALTAQFAGVNTEADEELEAAISAGVAQLDDHVLALPQEAGEASRALDAMIDEADEYCRQGEHLLTLETPDDCVAYRGWYLGQIVDQLAGRPPVAWPDSSFARSL
jgi:hypothetical protein